MRARIDAYLAVLVATLYALIQASWLTLTILLISRFVLPVAFARTWQEIGLDLPELSDILWLLIGPFVLMFAVFAAVSKLTVNLALVALLHAGVFLGCLGVCVTSVLRVPTLAATGLLRRSGERWLSVALAFAQLYQGEHALHSLRRHLWSHGLRSEVLVDAIAEKVVGAGGESSRFALLCACREKVRRLRMRRTTSTVLAFTLALGSLAALWSWAQSAPAPDRNVTAAP
jgi:hypothetical protein